MVTMVEGVAGKTEKRAGHGRIGGDVGNGGRGAVDTQRPYTVRLTITGDADLLMHRYNADAVEAKGKAKKGSEAKKTDDLETYVYRTPEGELAIPGIYLKGAIVEAAKFRQDPRSPRKSMAGLAKAIIHVTTDLAGLGATAWQYESRMRVMVQRNGVTRVRPAMFKGWKLTFDVMVTSGEYCPPDVLRGLVTDAGRLVGLADFRPTYGRFSMTGFEELVGG